LIINVRLLGVFRALAGKDQLMLKLECATIRDVVQVLAESLPKEARAMLSDPELNDLCPNALVLLNGREISVLKGPETAISDGDEVMFIPVAHGG